MSSDLWSLLDPSLTRNARRTAWVCRERKNRREVSYGQLREAALHIASELRELDVEPGDVVGVTAPNGPEWTVAALATWKLGACLAPIHIGNSYHEIGQQVAAVAPSAMLVHDCKREMFDNPRDIVIEADPARVREEAAIAPAAEAGETAMRIYTSGSTGNPKVVRLSHRNLVSNAEAVAGIGRFNRDDRFISLLPFSHAMGLTANLTVPLYAGARIVAPRVIAAGEILLTLEQEHISVVVAVPRLFRNIMLGLEKRFAEGGEGLRRYRAVLKKLPVPLRRRLNAPLRKKFGGRIKYWVSGGSHLDGRISRYYHNLGLPLRQGYGLTETSPVVSLQDDFDSAVESVGKPIEGVEVKIHQPDAGGSGELWLRGPNVMLGYDDPEQTSEVMQDGWFKTGDIARLDEAGRIVLTGRKKRLIVTDAGKNVYPEELETLLERDPVVKEAGVLEAELRPVAVLAMDGDDPEAEARRVLKDFNELVSPHNRIQRFALMDELPRTPLGKMALQQLPEVFAANEIT
ncbi:MAG: AMP-binding protein [Pseudomonadota bacterium]|nr:AMP-binding protein [Pseudomonadota bacterium]